MFEEFIFKACKLFLKSDDTIIEKDDGHIQ